MRAFPGVALTILLPVAFLAGGVADSASGENTRSPVAAPVAAPVAKSVAAVAAQAHPRAGAAPGVGGAGLELLRRRGDDLPRPVWTGEEPLSLVVVFDLSSSVSGARLQAAVAGLRALFASLDAEDRCALLGFTRSVELHAGWDGTCADAAAAAEELRSGGPAALNNALTLAFGLVADSPGRPVVVVFTDGVDGASWARDSWPLFAAGAVPPTVLAVTAPPDGEQIGQGRRDLREHRRRRSGEPDRVRGPQSAGFRTRPARSPECGSLLGADPPGRNQRRVVGPYLG